MLSQAEVFAISAVIPNYNNRRAYYGFCYADEIAPYMNELNQKQQQYTIIKVLSDDDNVDSAIIEVSPNYLQQTLINEMPGTIHEGDLKEFVEQNEKNKLLFEKFLVENCDNFNNIIGLYNLNYNNVIEHRGQAFKSFGITIGDALPLLQDYGYIIKVGANRVTPQQFYQVFVNRDKNISFTGFRMSPNSRGVFIGIQSTFNTQQKEQMKQIFNNRYRIRG